MAPPACSSKAIALVQSLALPPRRLMVCQGAGGRGNGWELYKAAISVCLFLLSIASASFVGRGNGGALTWKADGTDVSPVCALPSARNPQTLRIGAMRVYVDGSTPSSACW